MEEKLTPTQFAKVLRRMEIEKAKRWFANQGKPKSPPKYVKRSDSKWNKAPYVVGNASSSPPKEYVKAVTRNHRAKWVKVGKNRATSKKKDKNKVVPRALFQQQLDEEDFQPDVGIGKRVQIDVSQIMEHIHNPYTGHAFRQSVADLEKAGEFGTPSTDESPTTRLAKFRQLQGQRRRQSKSRLSVLPQDSKIPAAVNKNRLL